MDQQLSERGLSLRPFDPEVFARVWSRVMPDQTLSPIQPALPALRSPAQTAPAPSCLGEGSARYVPQLEALMDQLHAALGSASWPGGAEAGPPACWPPSPPTSSGSSAACPPPIFSSPAGAMLPRGRGPSPLDRCPPPCAPCFSRPSSAPPRPPCWPGQFRMTPVSADCWRTSRTRPSPTPPRSGSFWKSFCKNPPGRGPPPVVK